MSADSDGNAKTKLRSERRKEMMKEVSMDAGGVYEHGKDLVESMKCNMETNKTIQ